MEGVVASDEVTADAATAACGLRFAATALVALPPLSTTVVEGVAAPLCVASIHADMSLRAAFCAMRDGLVQAGVDDAAFDAAQLLQHVTGLDRRLHPDAPLTHAQAETLCALTQRRAAREPLQYLLGTWDFLDVTLRVGQGVLIPRADTEIVCETAIAAARARAAVVGAWAVLARDAAAVDMAAVATATDTAVTLGVAVEADVVAALAAVAAVDVTAPAAAPVAVDAVAAPAVIDAAAVDTVAVVDTVTGATATDTAVAVDAAAAPAATHPIAALTSTGDTSPPLHVIDLCAGSGAIAIGVARAVPQAEVTAVELSDDAFVYLQQNIAALAPRIRAVKADVFTWQEMLPRASVDVIVSNPPYIAQCELQALAPELAYEPRMALHAAENGLAFYRHIARAYRSALRKGGVLVLEIGSAQGDSVCAILRENGYADIAVQPDAAGLPRCVCAIAL